MATLYGSGIIGYKTAITVATITTFLGSICAIFLAQVIIASKFGVSVSTTHVSVGSLFGIGVLSKNSNNKVIKSIILSWLITLPVVLNNPMIIIC